MYRTSYVEDFIEELYENVGIREPHELDKYRIGNRLNVGIYLVDGDSEACRLGDRHYIFLDSKLDRCGRWQDFGHELCHVLRHAGHQGEMEPMFRDLQEWQADSFAYHFCVPTFMLQRIRLPPDRREAVQLIADTFRVECQFADERLTRYQQKLFA